MKYILEMAVVALLILAIMIKDQGYFTGLCVLAGAIIITLGIMNSIGGTPPYNQFLKFSAALENGPLDENEFKKQVGETTVWSAADQRDEHTLTDEQKKALERLIYEGKITKRNGKLSLS